MDQEEYLEHEINENNKKRNYKQAQKCEKKLRQVREYKYGGAEYGY